MYYIIQRVFTNKNRIICPFWKQLFNCWGLKEFRLLYQNVSHGFDIFVSIIWAPCSRVSTRVRVVRASTCTKTDSGVATTTIIMFVPKKTDSCFGSTGSVESFPITVDLQRGLWTNQSFPRASTLRGGTVLPISDQWVQRVGLLVDDDEVDFLVNLHTKTDFGERCVRVGR